MAYADRCVSLPPLQAAQGEAVTCPRCKQPMSAGVRSEKIDLRDCTGCAGKGCHVCGGFGVLNTRETPIWICNTDGCKGKDIDRSEPTQEELFA